ncbi:MAG: type II CRISPR-associated endonuclease Cas1 [Defluviitaleaceae bacterium]|nr:type II CRISPR-associated endonuclease Cas1 [Defluviitaleaceae bacterium]
MPYRNIIIQNEAALSLKNKQIRIKTDTKEATIPIEDVDTILIESRQTTISTSLLSALAGDGVALFVCDEFHLPCAVLTPFAQHSRHSEVAGKQLALGISTKKQLWKQIVSAKINNQSKCLLLCGEQAVSHELATMAKNVRSGDAGHSEGYAAAKYFPALFGKGFIRGKTDDCRNAWLNYGYAIVRGCVARSLAVYGFLPMIGLQHHSALNQFNLADDFIEPYRQIVDVFTAKYATCDDALTSDIKNQLVNLINYDIALQDKRYTLSRAIELTIQSFSAICSGRAKTLLLPELVELKMHTYE